MIKTIKRGDIYWVTLDPTVGSEIKKTRPALVISNSIQNKISSRIIIIPIISSTDKIFPFEAILFIEEKKSKVLADQIRAVDKTRIGDFISSITSKEMHQIGLAIKVALNLE